MNKDGNIVGKTIMAWRWSYTLMLNIGSSFTISLGQIPLLCLRYDGAPNRYCYWLIIGCCTVTGTASI